MSLQSKRHRLLSPSPDKPKAKKSSDDTWLVMVLVTETRDLRAEVVSVDERLQSRTRLHPDSPRAALLKGWRLLAPPTTDESKRWEWWFQMRAD